MHINQYPNHINNECKNQSTVCEKCGEEVPSFVFNTHFRVCIGKNSAKKPR